jgi:TolB-like protein/Tfp pilus assembly protein PilF
MEELMKGTFRIGNAMVQPALNSIACEGRTTHVEPKAMGVLVYLAEHATDVVPKERLIQAIWADTYVTDDVLTRCVSNLRRALHDDARDSHVIQTIPKSGYRLAVPVEWTDQEVIDSLAVLPFVNDSGDPSLEYFSDGVTESIINRLSELPQLRVVAWSTAFRFKGNRDSPLTIGKELGVGALLTGRVTSFGSTLTISTELISIGKGTQLWGQRYRRDAADILLIQDEISREISERLCLKLTAEQRRRLTRRYTEDTQAYHLYLRGRYLWNKRTEESIRKAVRCFEEAINHDPAYALAYAGLADCYGLMSCQIHYGILPPCEGYPKAEAAAKKALALDPSLAEAYASLGLVLEGYYWDWPAAERAFQQALELNPGYATGHHWYALLLSLLGRRDEAFSEIHRALELDSLSLIINTDAGWIYYFAREFDRAVEQLLKVLDLEPGFVQAHTSLGHVYARKGMLEAARAEFKEALRLSNLGSSSCHNIEHKIPIAVLGYAAAAWQGEQNQHGVERLRGLFNGQDVPACFVATWYANRGDNEQALVWLEQALEVRSNGLIYLAVDPVFDALRSDPRFGRLLRAMGLPAFSHQRDARTG